MFMLIGKMGSQQDDMKKKLELIKTSKENESFNIHDNNGDDCIDNIVLIGSRLPTRHSFIRWTQSLSDFVFFHCIRVVWTVNLLVDKVFCHLSHGFCKNVIRLIIVIIFPMSEFNCLFCENYNNSDIEDNSYVLVYFYVCVLLSLLSSILFHFFIKNQAMAVQHLGNRLVSNKNNYNYSEWNTLLQQSHPNGTNRNNNRNSINIFPRGVGKTDKNMHANLSKYSDIYSNTSDGMCSLNMRKNKNLCVPIDNHKKNDLITGRRSQSDGVSSFPSSHMNSKSVGDNENQNSDDIDTSDRTEENKIQLHKDNSKNCKNSNWTSKFQRVIALKEEKECNFNGVGGTFRRRNKLISRQYNKPSLLIANDVNQSSSIDNGSTTESVLLSVLLPSDNYTPETNKSSVDCLDGLDVSKELDDILEFDSRQTLSLNTKEMFEKQENKIQKIKKIERIEKENRKRNRKRK